MASKKKKAAKVSRKTAKSKAGKSAVKKKAAPVKKKALKKKKPTASPAMEMREFFVQGHSGSKAMSVIEVLKKEKYRSFDRKFEIQISKDKKKKKLIFDVFESRAHGLSYLPQQRFPLRMPDLTMAPKDVPGYADVLVIVKKSIDTLADGMLNNLKRSLWSQFGAAIDMVQNAIPFWPDDEWMTDKRFFYNAYHVLVFLDHYLSFPAPKFSSPLPFTITDRAACPPESIDDVIPNKIYSKEELLDYTKSLREKCKSVISSLTADWLKERWIEKESDMDYVWMELLFNNMRHVQHHAAQLNMLLRQKINHAPDWVSKVKDQL